MVNQETIISKIESLVNSISETDRQKLRDFVYIDGEMDFSQVKSMRESQSFLYRLNQYVNVSGSYPEFFYCTDSELTQIGIVHFWKLILEE